MNIGVFDSGIGGQSVAKEIKRAFPAAKITLVNDRKNLPYGAKSKQEIIKLTEAAIVPLFKSSDIIVLACNSATAAAIEFLRGKYPKMPFIGLEPMIKPAAGSTNTGVIAICATPATLASQRYRNLKSKYAQNVKVLEPDCSDWAYLIEHKKINAEKIHATINKVCEQNADVIALACTHYHWIKQEIIACADSRAEVIEPTEAIIRQIKKFVKEQKFKM